MSQGEHEIISIRGAAEHNLKTVDLDIPKRQLVVFTGVSGSGKSSLAFDTLFAEGQRRYVESLSSYARQFLGQMEKPAYESIRGLSPTISIEQKTAGRNPRSTVGTITEIYDYCRVLWARAGLQHCTACGELVSAQSAQQIVDEIARLPEGTKLVLLAPLIQNRKGEHREIFEEARKSGFARVRVDGEILALDGDIVLDKKKKHDIELVVDRIKVKTFDKMASRLTDSVETALRFGDGTLLAAPEGMDERIFSEHLACPSCAISFPELSPQSFSFNSPLGMCPECNGLGTQLDMDPELLIPDETLSVAEGAIVPWRNIMESEGSWTGNFVRSVAEQFDVPLDVPWKKIPTAKRELLLHGSGRKKVRVSWSGEKFKGELKTRFEGLIPTLLRRLKQTRSDMMRKYYGQFLCKGVCPACEGTRIHEASRAVLIEGRSLSEVMAMTVAHGCDWFESLQLEGARGKIAEELCREIRGRLRFLNEVGLRYLSLDREASTLSGGEAQRIRLASQIGSELTGVLYVLDEPSIGLHARDNLRLLGSLRRLRDLGNSVVVVEHDAETMREADWLVDFGPGAGQAGGRIVATGRYDEVLANPESLTGRYLSGELSIPRPAKRRKAQKGKSLILRGARANNLKSIDVKIPLGCFVAVTGVSGAGKSSLVNEILFPALARALHGATRHVGGHDALEGLELVDKVIDIDQDPIGRTPRSNPATYVKVWDHIRKVFAELKESRIHGYEPGRFSFNVKGGRCESCQGDGMVKVEMHFLPDVYVPCELCKGRRFNEATLKVRYKGLNVAEILDSTVDQAAEVFAGYAPVRRILETLQDVGMGYVKLGQPSPTLSGGEAQRIKLSRELARRSTGRTIYILDEPTTGLHFDDVRKLIKVLDSLVEAGNTVLVIEHNLDVVKVADWVVDLGPEGGEEGGAVVVAGTPEAVAACEGSHTGRYLREVLPG